MVLSVYYKIIAVSPARLQIWGQTGSMRIIPSGSLTAQHMSNTSHEGRLSVYEIGYLIATAIPEEKVPAEIEAIHSIITKAGATIIADEAAHLEPLAYTMRTKNVSGSYISHDEAYFGWVKFEIPADAIEGVKKAIEVLPSIVRILVISTFKESTYLGKRAPAIAAAFGAAPTAKKADAPADEKKTEKSAAPASSSEIDKSIDDMVKEV